MLNKNFFLWLPMGMMMCACQEEEFGCTYEEVHHSWVEREYIKAFCAEFPAIDPDHDWMCTPDTIFYNNEVMTRAGGVTGPEISLEDNQTLNLSLSAVSKALDYMKEAEDNNEKCAQDFEFIALETTTYEISPTFWGEKFCDFNEVGVYYMDGDMKKELPTFWNDKQTLITAVFTNGDRSPVTQSTHPIYADPDRSTYNNWPEMMSNGAKIDHFELPVYTLTVPKGVKWGLYLVTDKTQNSGTSRVTWYSNSAYNEGYKAAATFTYEGVTYCSFEDAPHDCGRGSSGSCTHCHYGHYDHDYNDIVLTITPRPIESTYRAIKYRVMCEDLGGTFDWDFNDVVYDVVYEEGKEKNKNATVSIVVQAVGGTLPIYIEYTGTNKKSLDKTSEELHHLLSDQLPDEEGLYVPVNVASDQNATIRDKVAKTILTFTLSKNKYSDKELDIRDYVKNITVKAVQNGVFTSQVVFPEEKADAVPQCFMTSTGTEWADELQNINRKYPLFPTWVASQQLGANWWMSDPDF